jgi:DNA polymerase III epsilon subunit-like protein
MTRLLVIDTETGGLDPQRHSLLSVGLVLWESGTLGAEDEFYVREPEIHCDPEAMAVNGLDVHFLESVGLVPQDAVERLENFLDRNFPVSRQPVLVAGHNVAFDVAFVRRLYRLAGRPGPRFSHRLLDTAGILRFLAIAGRLPDGVIDSSSAFKHFGIDFGSEKRHSALADARATAKLLTRLIGLVQRGLES